MNTVVLDLFLGDSGKGKIVDYLAKQANAVIRFNGSNNAGHTIRVNDEVYKTHCVPSGVLYPNVTNIIGHGCSINPEKLLEEINTFKDSIILISSNAHVVLPSHVEKDIQRETTFSIGSTKQGVAPCFSDKAFRKGFRYGLFLLSKKEFNDEIKPLGLTKEEKEEYKNIYNLYHKDLRKHIVLESHKLINNFLKQGGVVFEGAQGTYLDVDLGRYPFVTSSNTTIGSVFTGTGANPKLVTDVIGVFKAYGSYVGTGTWFKDISDDATNERLCELGSEYGTTTGRRRRLCWLDLDAINAAIEINGVDRCVMSRMDTLELLGVFKCVLGGKEHVFTTGKDFLSYVTKHLAVPLWAIGTGPDRNDLVLL